jgi:methylphosphotriester-DNA--protein-cysteine methyltransferase
MRVPKDANVGSDITLGDLAQLVAVQTSFLDDRRLTRVVDALRHGEMSLERIRCEAGFKSTPGFSNVFTKHYGMSASKFWARSD